MKETIQSDNNDAIPRIFGMALLAQVGVYLARQGIGFLLNRFNHRQESVVKTYMNEEEASQALTEISKAISELHFDYLSDETLEEKIHLLPKLTCERYQSRCRWADMQLQDLKASLKKKNLKYLTSERLEEYKCMVSFLLAEYAEFERVNAKLLKIKIYDDLFKNRTGLLLREFLMLDKTKTELESVVSSYGYKAVEFSAADVEQDEIDDSDLDDFYQSIIHQILSLELKGDFSKISLGELKQKALVLRSKINQETNTHLALFSRLYQDLFNEESLLMNPLSIQRWRHYIRTIAISRALQMSIIVIPSDDSVPIVIKQPRQKCVLVIGYSVENKYYSLVLDKEESLQSKKNIQELFSQATEDNYQQDLIDPLLQEHVNIYGYKCVAILNPEDSFLCAVIDQLARMGKINLPLDRLKELVRVHTEQYKIEYAELTKDRIQMLACARILDISIVIISADDTNPTIIKRRKPQAIIAIGYEGGSQYHSLLKDMSVTQPLENINNCYHQADEDGFTFSKQTQATHS